MDVHLFLVAYSRSSASTISVIAVATSSHFRHAVGYRVKHKCGTATAMAASAAQLDTVPTVNRFPMCIWLLIVIEDDCSNWTFGDNHLHRVSGDNAVQVTLQRQVSPCGVCDGGLPARRSAYGATNAWAMGEATRIAAGPGLSRCLRSNGISGTTKPDLGS